MIRENKLLQRILWVLVHHTPNEAFVIDGTSYSYAQLTEYIVAIIAYLKEQDCNIVGVVAEDKIETYASILSVLLCGKTYVILHPSYPSVRNKTIASVSGLQELLYVDNDLSDCEVGFEKKCVKGLKRKVSEEDLSHLAKYVSSYELNNIAYIIFTSGSTGQPKGVPISYTNLNAFYQAYERLGWKLDETDRMLQMFELAFDVSVVSTLYPLTIGASVYTVGVGNMKYLKVYELLEDARITFAAMPPSMLQFLLPYFDEISLPEMKYLVVTAEASPVSLINKFRRCIPNADVVNLYGPTECTIYCTSYIFPASNCKNHNGMAAIGKAFYGIETIILDDNDQEVGTNVMGELCVSGEQVMQGYWHDAQLSLKVFVEIEGKTYYRTGDLCTTDEEGDLIYCGRKNSQVKVHGFRVELNEIEYVSRLFFSGEKSVAALPVYDEAHNCDIYLYVETEEKLENKCEPLKDYLKTRLPEYMIPKRIYFLPKFPINTSGKIDRIRLSEYR